MKINSRNGIGNPYIIWPWLRTFEHIYNWWTSFVTVPEGCLWVLQKRTKIFQKYSLTFTASWNWDFKLSKSFFFLFLIDSFTWLSMSKRIYNFQYNYYFSFPIFIFLCNSTCHTNLHYPQAFFQSFLRWL